MSTTLFRFLRTMPAAATALALSGAPVAQGMGARESTQPTAAATSLHDFAVEHYIRIEGKAEVRVEPTGIRVVFAVTTRAETPSTCREQNTKKREAFLTALQKVGFAADASTSDFISMLPVYEWRIEQQNGQRVAMEHLVGYLMQTNVHVRAADEAEANKAVAEAFRLDIPDIIAFDYWCRDLHQHKVKAQELALAECKRKAGVLLSVLDEKPKPINVHEATETILPSAFYRSFENTYSQKYQANYWGNQSLPQITAMRPKNYYYAGFDRQVDVQDATMPTRPQISVVSTVQIYYRPPVPPGEPDNRR